MARAFRVGLAAPLRVRDPRVEPDYANQIVEKHVFNSVYEAAQDGRDVQPVLLELPLQREDEQGLVLSAAVLPGKRFSDGRPVTAAAIAASLQATPAFARVARASVRGTRVVFELARPYSRFELALSALAFRIAARGDGGCVGTGPYSLESAADGQSGRLLRNPCFDGPVQLDEVELRVLPPRADGRLTALVEALSSGALDYSDALMRQDLDEVRGVRKIIELGHTTGLLFFNTTRPPYDQARVRQALARAIDRRRVASVCWPNPLAFAATGLLPPRLHSYPDGLSPDLTQAREGLRAAGVDPARLAPVLLSIHMPRPHLPQPALVAEAVAHELQAVGLAPRVELARDAADFARRAAQGDYDLMLSGWVPSSIDPRDFLESLLASDAVPGGVLDVSVASNLARFRDLRLDAALDRARREGSDEALRAVHDVFHAELPCLPLLFGPRCAALTWRATARPGLFGDTAFLHRLEVKG